MQAALRSVLFARTAGAGPPSLLQQVSAFAGSIYLPMEGAAFQERTGASASTSAAIDGSPIGSLKNLGARGGYRIAPSDAARPLTRMVGGRPVMRFDGVDDLLFDADPYLYAAGAATVFVAVTCTVQTAATYLIAETRSTADAPVYAPALRAAPGNQLTGYLRNDQSSTRINLANVGGTYAGAARVLGFRDTGASVVPYEGVTPGAALAYSRTGTLTLDQGVLGTLKRPTATAFFNGDIHGVVAMAGQATTEQIAAIVALLNERSGA